MLLGFDLNGVRPSPVPEQLVLHFLSCWPKELTGTFCETMYTV